MYFCCCSWLFNLPFTSEMLDFEHGGFVIAFQLCICYCIIAHGRSVKNDEFQIWQSSYQLWHIMFIETLVSLLKLLYILSSACFSYLHASMAWLCENVWECVHLDELIFIGLWHGPCENVCIWKSLFLSVYLVYVIKEHLSLE